MDDGPYAATERDVVLNVNAANGVLANDTDADNLSAPFNAGLDRSTHRPAAGRPGNGQPVSRRARSPGRLPQEPISSARRRSRYRAVDPQSNQSNDATVTINVASVNDAPVAVNDGPGGIYVTNEDVPLVISLPNSVLSNDTDVENAE